MADDMSVDINIEDILVDPTLDAIPGGFDNLRVEEEIGKGMPLEQPKPEPTLTKKDLRAKESIDVNQELVRMYTEKNQIPEEKNAIINDPQDLLDGTINPNEIVQQLITDPTRNDALCSVVKRDDATNDIYKQVMREIAEELSYLKAYRKVHYLANADISEVSVKRVKALKTFVEILVEKDKAKNSAYDGKIDFSGERFEKVMEFILGMVKETFEKVGIPDQFNDIFFIQLAQNLEGFEKKVEKIYYESSKK